MNPTLSIAILITCISMGTPVIAADENNVTPGLTAAGAPLGLHGVDPVAFIDLGNRVEGDAANAAVYNDVAYYFASAENMKAFKADPSVYEPQNGGFCTYGVSVGKKFDGDPRYAAIVDGKLYVFLSAAIMQAFNRDRSGTIAKAERAWPAIQHIAATEL